MLMLYHIWRARTFHQFDVVISWPQSDLALHWILVSRTPQIDSLTILVGNKIFFECSLSGGGYANVLFRSKAGKKFSSFWRYQFRVGLGGIWNCSRTGSGETYSGYLQSLNNKSPHIVNGNYGNTYIDTICDQ